MTYATPFSEIGRAAAESAARAAKISMDSAERAFTVQMEYAKGALKQATLTARAAGEVKDVQELLALRARIAENALENLIGYSRSLYVAVAAIKSQLAAATAAFDTLTKAARNFASYADAAGVAATRQAKRK